MQRASHGRGHTAQLSQTFLGCQLQSTGQGDIAMPGMMRGKQPIAAQRYWSASTLNRSQTPSISLWHDLLTLGSDHGLSVRAKLWLPLLIITLKLNQHNASSRHPNPIFKRLESIIPRGTSDSAKHPGDQINIAIIGPKNSGKACFLHSIAGQRYHLKLAANRVTAIQVTVERRKVTLLVTPDIGAVENGQEVAGKDVLGMIWDHIRSSRHAAQPNINPFVEICKGVAQLPSVVLVLAEKTLLEADEIQRTVLSEEPCEKANAKVLSFESTGESAEGIIQFMINCIRSEG
ncbi:hypothetical protein EDD16DRAFT_1519041 [Pisolithus croceorrhizus]|nr:hypothetical protein EDD16DRAFT_1519041 [Pisolithus croceorrhizus]